MVKLVPSKIDDDDPRWLNLKNSDALDHIWDVATRSVIKVLARDGMIMLTTAQLRVAKVQSDIIIARMKVIDECPICSTKLLVPRDFIIQIRKTREMLNKKRYLCLKCKAKEGKDFIELTKPQITSLRRSKGIKPFAGAPQRMSNAEMCKKRNLLPHYEVRGN